MSQIELPYEDTKQKIVNEIKKHQFGFLATSDGDFVTVREIRCVPHGVTIYCFTNRNTKKCKQIMKNPNVAVAYGNHRVPNRGIQIEGVATLKGHPLDEENTVFLKAYKETQPAAYERSMQRHFVRTRPDLRVLEIVPRRITLMVQGETPAGSYFELLDIDKREATRVMAAGYREALADRK